MPRKSATEEKRTIYKLVGTKIRQIRRRDPRRITQEQLAEVLNVSRTSVANYESGLQAIYISDLYKIAEFLNVEVGTLLPQRCAA